MTDAGAATISPAPTVDASELAQWLADRDVPCPLCRYNLRGLASNRCPECGRELRLGVSVVEPFSRVWVSLLVALLLPAGFGLVVIIGLLYWLAQPGGSSIGRGGWNIPVGPTLVLLHVVGSVPASVVTLAGRRRFLRWPRRAQVGVAAAAWLALASTVLYLLSFLR
jgi:hypothetical protein